MGVSGGVSVAAKVAKTLKTEVIFLLDVFRVRKSE